MRHFLLGILAIAITFISCEKDSNTYKLEGEAIGFADGAKIYVHTFENKQPIVLDTLTVKDEKFSAEYPKKDELGVNFLRTDQAQGTVIYFPENENLNAVLYKDSLFASRVTGGNQNKAYNEYVKEMSRFNDKKKASMEEFQKAQQNNDTATIARLQSENLNMMAEESEYKKNFLKTHDKSIFSMMLLAEMVNRGEMPPAEAKAYLQDLDPKVEKSEITQELKNTLDSMGKAEIGSKAPEFSAPTPEGKELALSEALGKYTIIDFWASWCRPCRIENPNVVKVYQKYHDKGLNIISVSLDKENEREKWLQAIKDDNMDWYHVSNLKFWNDPIAKEYSVRSIPATFLLDEKGNIIDKNLRGAALEAKMATLFGDK